MEPLIKEILADLYRIDPELKTHEAELAKLVSRLLAARPDADLDEKFRQELRERLLAEFAASRREKRSLAAGLARFFAANRFGLAASGTLAAVIIAVALLYSPTGAPVLTPTTGDTLALGPRITPAADHAFGSLALTTGNDASNASIRQSSSAPTPLAASATSEIAPLGLGGGGASGVPGLKMIAPDMMPSYIQPTRYRFNYTGELAAPAAQVEILKRDTSLDTGALTTIFAKLDLGLMNFAELRNLAVQNINLVEDRDFGYQISLNFDDGSISINQNWNRWPQTRQDCAAGQDCSPPRVRQEDIPADEELIRIAAEFAGRLGISTDAYAAPKVDSSWRRWYAQAENKADYWFPEQVSVNYPLLVNGKKVYYNDGREAGLSISIDVRARRVTNVSPIYSQRYLSSAYAGETDPARILEVAAQGGIMPYYGGGEEAKVIDVSLAEPESAYYWHWSYQNGRSESLLVPALVFPVPSASEDSSLYLEKVVVPLAKEILDQAGQNAGPMPYLLKGGTATTTAEPAATK
ncbi:MAG: hypothetical protein WCT10_05690 [Patescibacteria group bacterium]|jgi:hypothetical protein